MEGCIKTWVFQKVSICYIDFLFKNISIKKYTLRHLYLFLAISFLETSLVIVGWMSYCFLVLFGSSLFIKYFLLRFILNMFHNKNHPESNKKIHRKLWHCLFTLCLGLFTAISLNPFSLKYNSIVYKYNMHQNCSYLLFPVTWERFKTLVKFLLQ